MNIRNSNIIPPLTPCLVWGIPQLQMWQSHWLSSDPWSKVPEINSDIKGGKKNLFTPSHILASMHWILNFDNQEPPQNIRRSSKSFIRSRNIRIWKVIFFFWHPLLDGITCVNKAEVIIQNVLILPHLLSKIVSFCQGSYFVLFSWRLFCDLHIPFRYDIEGIPWSSFTYNVVSFFVNFKL